MPTYTYECGKCSARVEIQCKLKQMKKWIKCLACGKRANRVIEAPAIMSGLKKSEQQAKAQETRQQEHVARRGPVKPSAVGIRDAGTPVSRSLEERSRGRITCDREDIV